MNSLGKKLNLFPFIWIYCPSAPLVTLKYRYHVHVYMHIELWKQTTRLKGQHFLLQVVLKSKERNSSSSCSRLFTFVRLHFEFGNVLTSNCYDEAITTRIRSVFTVLACRNSTAPAGQKKLWLRQTNRYVDKVLFDIVLNFGLTNIKTS